MLMLRRGVVVSADPLTVEVDGNTPASQYDRLDVLGGANLAGALTIEVGRALGVAVEFDAGALDLAGRRTELNAS